MREYICLLLIIVINNMRLILWMCSKQPSNRIRKTVLQTEKLMFARQAKQRSPPIWKQASKRKTHMRRNFSRSRLLYLLSESLLWYHKQNKKTREIRSLFYRFAKFYESFKKLSYFLACAHKKSSDSTRFIVSYETCPDIYMFHVKHINM